MRFGSGTSGVSFDNAAGTGGTETPPPLISTLSAVGVNGAFAAGGETGSPGTITEPPPPGCVGSDIEAIGSSLQLIAHENVWGPAFESSCAGKGSEPTVTYVGAGSGAGLDAWDFNGPDATPFDTSRAFVASDEAPSASQIANAESAAGGAKVLVIPVAQTAIGIAVNPPANCSIEEITNKQLESVFRGNIKYWGKIGTAFGAGCPGSPITRVVRSGSGSGTTYQFKDYLYHANSAALDCTEAPGKDWRDLEPIGGAGSNPNLDWPESGVGGCSATALSPVVRAAGSSGADLVKKVNTTNGSFGYAALPDIEANRGAGGGDQNPEADTTAVRLQNNGLVKLANASFAEPATDAKSANCAAARYAVPAAARFDSGSGEGVDWSQVFGADPNTSRSSGNPEAYSLCTLTYVMALKGYSNSAGFSAAQVTTVRGYLTEYVAAAAGQAALDSSEQFYSSLPDGAAAESVLKAAQLAAGKVEF